MDHSYTIGTKAFGKRRVSGCECTIRYTCLACLDSLPVLTDSRMYDIVNARTGRVLDGPFRTRDAAAQQAMVMDKRRHPVAIDRNDPGDMRWLQRYQARFA
jgi:hypothetical protein